MRNQKKLEDSYEKISYFLIRTKIDDENNNIPQSNIDNFIKKNSEIKGYFEVSSKNSHNVKDMFYAVFLFQIDKECFKEITKNNKYTIINSIKNSNINDSNNDKNNSNNKTSYLKQFTLIFGFTKKTI
jgi:hypothetical protein